MTMNEIKDKVDHLGRAWEDFKRLNDQRLHDIERKGNADPITHDQLNKINHTIDETKSRIQNLELEQMRPNLGYEYSGMVASPMLSPKEKEHKQAFSNYLRKGMTEGLNYIEQQMIEQKALSVGSNPDGGYLVSPAMSDYIVKTIEAKSPMRQLASIETISSDSLEIIEDYDDMAASWVAETATRGDTNTAKVNKRAIDVHELYAAPKATQKLIDDSAIDVEQWLAEKIADIFAKTENTAFISGNGTAKPKGILSYTAGTDWGEVEQIDSGADATITAEGLIKLYFGLDEAYASRATYLMHRSSAQAVRLLKETTTGQYLWQPGLAAGVPDTIMGVPVMLSSDMPAPTSGSLSVALADFQQAYKIVDRTGIRILRDPFTDKPYVKFYTTKRVGGEVANYEALKLLKLSN